MKNVYKNREKGEIKMKELKRIFSNKDFLCDLVKDQLEEFHEMSHDEIKNCFLGEIQVDKKQLYLPFYEGIEEYKYGIYFKMISPKVDDHHEIICAVELREKPDVTKPSEIPACAGLSLMLMVQAKEENEGKKIAERCYGFYFYLNSDEELKGKQNKYNIHIRHNDQNLLENNRCAGIEIYL